MMRRSLLMTGLAILMMVVMVNRTPRAFAKVPEEEKVGPMNNAFASDLYARLSAKEGNLFFSPTSIQTALAMTWAGAQGQTAEEMAKVLHLEGNGKTNEELGGFLGRLNADGKKGGYELSVANALWGAKGYPFMPAYVNLVEKNYGGKLSDLDFIRDAEGSRKIINDWVAKETHDRIKDLIPVGEINGQTRLVLTNAIYFKGKWDVPFVKERTQDGDFTLGDGTKVKAPFMIQREHFRYVEDDEVQVLELPYGHDDLSMRVFLPKKADGLAAFEKKMTAERLADLSGKLVRDDVIVWLPRFTMESAFSLGEVLEAMGMKLAFDGGAADFSAMTSAEKLAISAVVHKAFVKVDEEGTEAAAATGVFAGAMAMPMKPRLPREFRADHPFVFEIVHQGSGAVLFMGRVAKP